MLVTPVGPGSPDPTGVLLLGKLVSGSSGRPAPSLGASGAPGGSSPGGAGVKGSPPLHDLDSVLGCQIKHRMSSYI